MQNIIKSIVKVANQAGIMRINLLYRYCSLIISSLIYWISEPVHTNVLKLGIMSGMLIACTTLVYLYINNREDPQNIAILVGIEMIGNSILIIVSGGFSSPYIWYSISTLIIVIKEFQMKWTLLTAVIYFVSAFATTFLGRWYIERVRLYINIGMSYIVVVAGLWCLVQYAIKIEEKNDKLCALNKELAKAKKKAEGALSYTIEMYETVDILTMNSEKNIMGALVSQFQALSGSKECMLVKVNRIGEIKGYCERGIPEGKQRALLNTVMKEDIDSSEYKGLRWIKQGHKNYLMTYIEYTSNTYGILVFTPPGECKCAGDNKILMDRDKEMKHFNKLVGIMLKRIDLEEIGGGLIASEEQNRIANEIHDTVLQKLFAISCNVFILENQCEALSTKQMQDQLRQIKVSIDGTMKELREAIYGLSWEKQGSDTFKTKLNDYIKELRQLHGIAIELSIEGDTQNVSVNQKTALYRVICEAINNGIRHGKADNIQVVMKIEDTATFARIKDNGIGFENDKHKVRTKGGLGLRNMYKIIGLLRGTLEIRTKEGKGTTVELTLPRENIA